MEPVEFDIFEKSFINLHTWQKVWSKYVKIRYNIGRGLEPATLEYNGGGFEVRWFYG